MWYLVEVRSERDPEEGIRWYYRLPADSEEEAHYACEYTFREDEEIPLRCVIFVTTIHTAETEQEVARQQNLVLARIMAIYN